jgi:predicted transcriptional regulator of viral defense system
VGAADVVDGLLAHGRSTFSTEEAAELLGVPADHVRVRMNPLVRQGKVFSPARSLWVAIPPEYRTWKATPGLQFLDAMMRHLDRAYYVGWLSAAELHGAAHQRPQVLQVAVDKHLADRDFGRVRLRFVERKHAAEIPKVQRTVPTGQVWVATAEATALDLAAVPILGAGVSNVATVLAELGEDGALVSEKLAAAAPLYPLAAVRRLGFLLETVDQQGLAAPLFEISERRRRWRPDLLEPSGPDTGPVDPRWRLVLNTVVEPDL